MSRSLSVEVRGGNLGVAASATNLPPSATILSPAPSTVYVPIVLPDVLIQWTGEDPEGRLREYRYRLFGRVNPDFPQVADFIDFLRTNPDSVLRYYDPSFKSWERLRVPNGADPAASVSYSGLTWYERYAFVVVAIDQRGEHDADLSLDRNVVQFAVSPALSGSDKTFRATLPRRL